MHDTAVTCRWCGQTGDCPGHACVGCGSTGIVYENYKGQLFCCPCAQCCDTTTEQGNDDDAGLFATLRGWLRRRFHRPQLDDGYCTRCD
ncbi:hypothetical protein [Streptomyces hydrogenans]|uniref:Uncharacterized protein n=1 Tax=Streptomyces hydrogenans TaxID=1873719 RepID=A0ABQ3PJM9_9ACTN|nr:hypothetical protein [Streptomyces hydrogenans]GHG10021.1 hypothetical protein GCM10018784_23360 [Streptomyces hydrogenans]GHI25212.1 hypothetical protein Shyd_65830 [Streptomyces hydrogenans]